MKHKLRMLLLNLVFMLAGVACLGVLSSCKDSKPTTSCLYGEDVPEDKLEPILKTAHKYMSMIEAQDYKELYEHTGSLVQPGQTRDQFAAVLKTSDDLFGTKQFSRIKEVYYMTSESKDNQVTIPCNLGAQGVNDLWVMPANFEAAAAIFESVAGKNLVRVVIQMVLENEEWKLISVSINPMILQGKKADYFIEQARKNREEGKLHLAKMQYMAAILLHELGPNVQEHFISMLANEMNQIQVDYMPMQSVQIWTTPSENSYNVYNLGVVGSGESLYLDLTYLTDSLKDTRTIERESRELARLLFEKFPEYKEGFDGIRTTAITTKEEDRLKSYHVIIPFDEINMQEKEEKQK